MDKKKTKIKIRDLPKNYQLNKKELEKISGGYTRSSFRRFLAWDLSCLDGGGGTGSGSSGGGSSGTSGGGSSGSSGSGSSSGASGWTRR